ncbi:hypothetical protein Back11_18200 [Paenibacillus baekrokdamisoli]|uniref:Uncharacterized protein n=1 Tax=Paenibacillus baekrokdamisoli TaxID=1712516 RepID=A0A3G9IWE4_9BACL|nr:glucosaminidase domain-containing protein [Paenibacillus baekrokdamisoli]MBB3072415.1 flagellum-specific peptidoglycan hydrolase FlgJ [Paenibacillus baekrokdamisoli]BBH20475.1 hypothetical protein Back11_18200 [Paenibacillus baekrokdamisoli]
MERNMKMTIRAFLISVALVALLMSAVISFNAINKGSSSPVYPKWELSQDSMFTPEKTGINTQSTNVKSTADTSNAQASQSTKHEEPSTSSIKIEAATTSTIHSDSPITYKVTSYYLNIRTEPNAKSNIINVVKNGSELLIVASTENGWLQLKDGGYVHGGYASPVVLDSSLLRSTTSIGLQKTAPVASVQPIPGKLHPKQAIQHKIESRVETGDPAKPTTIVKSDSGLTAADIAIILKGTKLTGQGLEEAILSIEDDYGINAFFTIAVMKLESGNGKSRLAKTKNNLFGLNAITGSENKKAFSFATKGDSVRKFGQLLAKNYVGKGLTTIEKVARKYCPSNGRWSGDVRSIMKSDYRKVV